MMSVNDYWRRIVTDCRQYFLGEKKNWKNQVF